MPAPNETVARAVELYPKIKKMLPAAMKQAGRRLFPDQLRTAAITYTLLYLRELGYAMPDDVEGKIENKLHRSKRPRGKGKFRSRRFGIGARRNHTLH